jgi:hypothetical protein
MTNFARKLDGAFEMPNEGRQVDEHTQQTTEYLLIYAAVDVAADTIDDDLFEMDMQYHRDGLSVTFFMAGFQPDDADAVPDGVVLRIDKPETSSHSLIEKLRERLQEQLTTALETLTVHISVPVIQAMITEMESLRYLISKLVEGRSITPVEAIWTMAKEGVAGRTAEALHRSINP